MSFDIKKYPGYTEMLFRNRKSTLTRKKPIATMETDDGLKIDMYDFYNKFYFFTKLGGFDEMLNIHNDLNFSANQKEDAIKYYQEKMKDTTINDVERIIVNSVTIKNQPIPLSEEYLDYCHRYIRQKGLDIPEENKTIVEQEQKEEQYKIAPLSFNENAVVTDGDDEWAGFPPETNLEELKPQELTSEDEEVFKQIDAQKAISNSMKNKKSPKSKKKSGKKKSGKK